MKKQTRNNILLVAVTLVAFNTITAVADHYQEYRQLQTQMQTLTNKVYNLETEQGLYNEYPIEQVGMKDPN